MTYNVFGGTLSLTQSINLTKALIMSSMYRVNNTIDKTLPCLTPLLTLYGTENELHHFTPTNILLYQFIIICIKCACTLTSHSLMCRGYMHWHPMLNKASFAIGFLHLLNLAAVHLLDEISKLSQDSCTLYGTL